MKQTSKWIAEWAKETGNGFDKSNAGWDESFVCAFVAWLFKKGYVNAVPLSFDP